MPRRLPLPCPALLALSLLLTLTGVAQAHRLEGEYRVLPGRKIRVECWFETGDAPKLAKVTILRANGEPLFTEPADMKEGVYVFTYDRVEALKIEISAGQGHHKVLSIAAAELGQGGAQSTDPRQEAAPPSPSSRERATGPDIQGLVVGVSFLLALAAFVIGLRNAWTLRRLQSRQGTRNNADASPTYPSNGNTSSSGTSH